MKRLRLVQEGVLYVNPSPGHFAQSVIYPYVVAHPSGDTLAFYRLGQALYSIDGQIAVSRLKRGDQNWVHEGPLQFPPDSATPYNYALAIPGVHRDGSIVVTATRFAASLDSIPRFNPETGGIKEGDEQVILVSHDVGRTWSAPRIMAVSREMCTSIHAPVLEVPDGRWMQIIEPWKAWGDTAPLHIKGFALFSSDKGRTWGGRLDFPWGGDASQMFSHAQFQRIPDGRVAGTQWAQSIGGQHDFGLTLAFGSPDGGRWTGGQETGINGQSSSLAGLVGGGLVVTYTCRESADPGIYIVLDETGKGAFDLAHQVRVWDAAGRDMLGSRHAAQYPASHDNVAFGKPHTAVLPDGQIISSWWCTLSSLTQCRFARLEVEDFSVKPSPGNPH